MRKTLLYIVLVIICGSCNNSNGNYSVKDKKIDCYLKASFANLPQPYVVLAAIRDYEPEIIDTLKTKTDGSFQFRYTASMQQGMYRLILGKDLKSQFFGGPDTYIDFIFNNEDIELSADFNDLYGTVKFGKSLENQVYFEFLEKDEKTNTQLNVLSQLKNFFPSDDEFYPDIKKRYNKLQDEYFQYIDKILNDHKELFAARIIRSKRYPKLEFELSDEDKSKYIKVHYFDNVDFNDTLLINTDVFSSKAFGYLQLYKNQQLPKDKQEKEFMKAIDFLFGRANVNEKVYKYVRNYIIKGFERIDSEPILTYIAENYTLKNTCESDKEALKLNRRVEGFKKLSIGSKSPDLNITDVNGKIVSLKEIQSEYVLVFFWASWCPHCTEMLPKLFPLYEKTVRQKMEIIAISIDNEEKSWREFLSKGNYPWINSCDFKAWEGKAATDYYVYATPTILLLDKERKILAKPITFDELENALKKAGIKY